MELAPKTRQVTEALSAVGGKSSAQKLVLRPSQPDLLQFPASGSGLPFW